MTTAYLLDTNVLLHLVNHASGYTHIKSRFSSAKPGSLYISAITVWEISRMVEQAKVPSKASLAALELMAQFPVEVLDKTSAAIGGNLHAALANQGITIGERDSMIAAIALSPGFGMVTDNTKQFCRIPGLPLENWRHPAPA